MVEPASPFVPGFHIDAIAEHLQATSRGDIRNLLITVPPRHGKSTLVSVLWPAWSWIRKPWLRWMFASYAASLSIRDSVRCRRLVESPWYQQRWGAVFTLTDDQNQKIRFENDQGGYRLSTSVGGAATGEGGHILVCLEWGMPITTDRGEIPIGRIVDERLPVRVLGPSGRWQAIDAYEANPGKPLLEIEMDDGTVLRCTDDHPIFIDGVGYRPAGDVIKCAYGTVHLRQLRSGVRAGSWARGESEDRSVLFAPVLRKLRARREESQLGRRAGYGAVQGMRPNADDEAEHRWSAPLLLTGVPRAQSQGLHGYLSSVSEDIHSSSSLREILQSLVREPRAADDDPWREERAVHRGQLADELHARLPRQPAAHDRSSGRERLRALSAVSGCDSSGSPHRRDQDESRADQPGDALHFLSSHGTPPTGGPASLDAPVRVRAVRRIGTPAAVYNLRVGLDHAYYAAGLLVHNCDDPHAVQEAESEAVRESTLDWWDQVMSTRLNDPATGARVIVQQRVHELDLAGHVLAQGGYTHLNLPAEYEPKTVVQMPSPIGWSDPRTEPGQLLWPERFDRAALDDLKLRLGSRAASAQLQQEPTPASGDILKREWWRFYARLPEKLDEVWQSWDMAFKDLKDSDYVVGQVWGRRGSYALLLDQVRARMTFVETLDAVRTLTVKYPKATRKLVEEAANGYAVLSMLEGEVGGLVRVKPEGGKVSRATAVSPLIEAGNVLLPGKGLHNGWVDDFIAECSRFPRGAHDDQVDAMTQALAHMTWTSLWNRADRSDSGPVKIKGGLQG